MSRLLRFFPLALLTFAVGLLSAASIDHLIPSALKNVGSIAASRSDCGADTDNNPEITEPIHGAPLEFCDLASDPDRFNGKTVRFRATLGSNKHGLLLFDRLCEPRPGPAAVFFYPPTRSEMINLLDRVDGKADDLYDFEPVDIVATGRFFNVTPSYDSDLNIDTSEFQIELMQIQSAKRARW